MTALATETEPRRKMRRAKVRQPIDLGNDIAEPRIQFAEKTIHCSDRTVQRMNLPTVYIGGIAHVLRNASLKQIAAKAARRHEPRPKRK